MMRISSRTTATSLALLLPAATQALAALPVTAIPISANSSCAVYPGWNASSNTAGPFTAIADSTGSSIDGNPASVASFTNDGTDSYGFITVSKAPPRNGGSENTTMRCVASQLQVQVRSSWVDVYIAGQENWQSSFSYGVATKVAPGIPVQAYRHSVGGVLADGIFLGAGNSTTWKYKYNWGGNAGEYYIVRWLKDATKLRKRQGEFPVLDDRDWVGYMKVVE